jgi:hypothetical protein
MVDAHPTTPCRTLFKKLGILPVPCQYIRSLTNFFANNQENSEKIHQHAVLIQGISTIYIDQLT